MAIDLLVPISSYGSPWRTLASYFPLLRLRFTHRKGRKDFAKGRKAKWISMQRLLISRPEPIP